MVKKHPKFHICDDWISCEISDLKTIHAQSRKLRASKQWVEVVGGLNSIAVQFDPGEITPDQAAVTLDQELSKPIVNQRQEQETIEMPICYDISFTPDLQMVADAVGISPLEIADWHHQFEFTVTMLGFMPGFAYLQCDADIPDIGRLDQPRKNVAAGSVGIIGDQSCIYSFNSPGGWPIIGRTPCTLFNPNRNPETMVSAGQMVRFTPISSDEFAKLS